MSCSFIMTAPDIKISYFFSFFLYLISFFYCLSKMFLMWERYPYKFWLARLSTQMALRKKKCRNYVFSANITNSARSQSDIIINFLQFPTCRYKSSLIRPSWYHQHTSTNTRTYCTDKNIYQQNTEKNRMFPTPNTKKIGSLRSLAISYMFPV